MIVIKEMQIKIIMRKYSPEAKKIEWDNTHRKVKKRKCFEIIEDTK